jgi:hypothetical protein
MREPSLAERYRCAAALWELDFNELGERAGREGKGAGAGVLLGRAGKKRRSSDSEP